MFVVIKTNGASSILINVPHEGSEKTLPAIAAMLENNAVFIQDGYRETNIVKPDMSIILGDKYIPNGSDDKQTVIVQSRGEVIDESFTIATPVVLTSNKKALERKDEEIKRVRTELELCKQQLADYRLQVEELSNKILGNTPEGQNNDN